MTTNTVNINFKLNADDKRLMENVCRELGLSMSAAFTIFAKKVGREHRIPFEVSADPFYNPENISRLKKSIAHMEETGGTIHGFRSMIKAWTDEAWEDFEYWSKQDKKTLKRILQLLKDIDRNGYNGIGKPEPLKGDFSGYWSRRIDDCNRIVYRIDGNIMRIVQCGSHYDR